MLAVCAIRVLRTGGAGGGGPGGFGEEAGLAESWRPRCGEQRNWGLGQGQGGDSARCTVLWQGLLSAVPTD